MYSCYSFDGVISLSVSLSLLFFLLLSSSANGERHHILCTVPTCACLSVYIRAIRFVGRVEHVSACHVYV